MLLERMSNISFLGWILFFVLAIFLIIIANLIFTDRAQIIFQRIQDMEVFSSGTEEEKLMRKPIYTRLYIMLEKRVSVFLTKNVERGKYAPLETKLIQANDYVTKPVQHWSKKINFAMGSRIVAMSFCEPRSCRLQLSS